MPLSHSLRFVFICVPKTGSTSLRTFLSRWLEPDRIRPDPVNRLTFDLHASYAEHIDKYPIAKDYYSFAFVRNPYMRAVSTYLYHFPEGTPDDMLKFFNEKTHERPPFKMFYVPQHYLVEGVKDVRKYENYSDACEDILQELGFEEGSSNNLPIENDTIPDSDKMEFLTEELREIIRELYSEDFRRFGYQSRS